MKEIFIDCARMTDRKAAHEYLAQVLELPDYYGGNLDALYDCLSELPPCHITLFNFSALSMLGDYGKSMRSVFVDVSMNTPDFELTIAEGAVDSSED